jgi:hypothetical protein
MRRLAEGREAGCGEERVAHLERFVVVGRGGVREQQLLDCRPRTLLVYILLVMLLVMLLLVVLLLVMLLVVLLVVLLVMLLLVVLLVLWLAQAGEVRRHGVALQCDQKRHGLRRPHLRPAPVSVCTAR